MAEEAGKYVTQVTIVTPPATGNQLIVKANPRRWYLRIDFNVGPTHLGPVCPGPVPLAFTSSTTVQLPVEVKFRDAPSLCTGEWYVQNAATSIWTIWETIYVGD